MTTESIFEAAVPYDWIGRIERFLLLERMKEDSEEFEKVRKSFINEHVAPKRADGFSDVVEELQALGCQRDVLYRCLYRFYRSDEKGLEIPNPSDIEVLVISMNKVIDKITRLAQGNVGTALRRIGMFGPAPYDNHWFKPESLCNDNDPFGAVLGPFIRERLLQEQDVSPEHLVSVLTWYTHRLNANWGLLRKDLIKVYSRVACCSYPLIATGHYQDELVAGLLDNFENTHVDVRDGVRSLEVARQKFEEKHAGLCPMLEKQLRDEHEDAKRQAEVKKDRRSSS